MNANPPDALPCLLIRSLLQDDAQVFLRAFATQAHAFDVLDRHGLVPLAVHTLTAADAAVPAPFRTRTQQLTARRLLIQEQLLALGARCARAGITAVVTRAFGSVAALYPTPECRPTNDLDLVVPPMDRTRLQAELQDLGYVPLHPHRPLAYTLHGITLDLALAPSDLFALTGLAIEAQAFPSLDTEWLTQLEASPMPGLHRFALAFECLLGALHYGYKHRFACHVWGLDLLLLLRALAPAEQDALVMWAARARSEHLLSHALRQAAALAGTDLPLLTRLPSHDPNRWRQSLLTRPVGGACGKDAGLLLAVANAPTVTLAASLAWHMIRRPPRHRTLLGFIERYVGMPWRVARALWARSRAVAQLDGRPVE